MKRKADELGVSGWVRNLPDGRVEAVVEGEENSVKRLIEWTWVGPPGARVDSVKVSWQKPTGEFRDFKIRY